MDPVAGLPNKTGSKPDPSAFRIRPARRGDGDQIAALLVELGYSQSVDVATVHWVLSHPEMEAIVAADAQDKAVGVLTLSHRPQLRMKGRIATIDELVVTASWRRRGIGRELLNRAMARAKVLSVKRLEILTHGPSDEALAFCKAMGFEPANASVLRLKALDFQR